MLMCIICMYADMCMCVYMYTFNVYACVYRCVRMINCMHIVCTRVVSQVARSDTPNIN